MLSGCVYIADGKQESKNLVMDTTAIRLPSPPEDKPSLLKQKFHTMCSNISASQKGLSLTSMEFSKYDATLEKDTKPLLIFGNVTLNKGSAARLMRICNAF